MLKKLTQKNILVLGGSGFVGQAIISIALQNGASVAGLSRRPPKQHLATNWINASIKDLSKFS